MVVELISVGTEILLGNIVNTNAAYLSKQCAALGLSLYYETSVGDNPQRLTETLKTALCRSDIVILSGGLGPTQDDLTKEIAAEVMGKKLVEDAHSRERIEAYFQKSQSKKITENNWKQAMVPEGSIVIDNHNGTAPGIIIEDAHKAVILLPGPPNELKPMFVRDVFPYLRKKQPEIIYSVMVKLCGVGESMVETQIRDLIDGQTNPTIATYAKTGEVDLRVTARASSEKEAKKLVKPMVKELQKRFGDRIFTQSEETTLEEAVLSMLRERRLTLTTVESLTGGMLSARLTGVAGASDVLKQGFVTYCNEAKHRMVGVKKRTLKEHGAVSKKTAKEMAKYGAEVTGADVCVSLTGLAGPGTEEGKPVGLTYIGCHYGKKTVVREFQFQGERAKIRESAVVKALTLLRDCLLEEQA